MNTQLHLVATCAASMTFSYAALADEGRDGIADPADQAVALEANDEAEDVWSAGASVDVSTQCVGRGIPCSAGGVVLPTVEFGAFGFTASATAYLGFDAESPQTLEEFDVGLSWAHELDAVAFEVGAFALTFPGIDDVHDHVELVASVAYALGPVTFSTEHVVEVLAEPGAYYGEIAVEAEFELAPVLSTRLSSAFGWANSKYNLDMFDVHDAMAQAIGGEVTLSWDVGGGFAIEPHAGAWYSTDERARTALESTVVWNTGVAVAGSW